jgi:hypothetical protein
MLFSKQLLARQAISSTSLLVLKVHPLQHYGIVAVAVA